MILETSLNNNELKLQRYELSSGQKALWFINAIGGAAQSAYNESLIYNIKGKISISVLEKALSLIINKHKILCTSFDKDFQGNLFQVIHQKLLIKVDLVKDLNQEEVDEYIVGEIKKPFDFTKPPLMRVSAIEVGNDEIILVIVMHHIITDGTSFGIFIDDLNNFYNKILNQEKLNVINESVEYADIINTDKNYFLTEEYLEKLNKMVESLKGYSSLNFLTTPIMQKEQDFYSGNRFYFTLDKKLFSKIKSFANTHRITIFHFLFSAYCLLVSKYTRSQDVIIGVPFANRELEIKRKIMGYFVNTLPIRINLNEKKNFLHYVSYVKTEIFSYLCNQNVVFEHVIPKLSIERKYLGQHPLIQTMFVLGSTDKLKLKFENTASQIEKKFFSKTSKFDLSLFMLEENKECINAYFEYRDMLFEDSIIESIANNFVILIENILDEPYKSLNSLSMINDEEKNRLKNNFFSSKLDRVVEDSLPSLFSKTAYSYPKKIGLIYQNNQYDYENLEIRTQKWASYIRYKYKELYHVELSSNTLIALCVDRSEDMIIAMLGILKSGAAYVPIDPKYPIDRINYIIADSKATLLLTHKKHDDLNLNFEPKHIIYIDDQSVYQSPYFSNMYIDHKIKPQDLAYVLYTSGSTGKPKGVGVSHENVICLFESLKKQFTISSEDVWSLFHTYCFDISIWEIWGAFLFGGTLLVIPFKITRDPKKFYQLIASKRVTVLTQTPSAFQMLINEDLASNKKLDYLRYVVFVGESLKVSILRPWVDKYGTNKPQLANMYGITETTVYTNYKFINQADINRGRDNIGWPLEEFSMCIMDENLNWCPIGIVGEICIGGRGVSTGYLYREDLTKEKFILDPYADFLGLQPGARLYRTGDLGRWLNDGSIEYLGRKDFQIKLRGFRVELGEIESILGSYEGISNTAVLLKGSDDSAYLSAYYTLKPGYSIEISKLISHLKSFVPDYMIPKAFTELKSFPITINGKIDRDQLYAYKDEITNKIKGTKLNSPLQKDIAAIWADVLNIPLNIIDTQANFFELGGNSLLVIKMLSQICDKIGKEISLHHFIFSPTIYTLSKQIEEVSGFKEMSNELFKKIKNDIILPSFIRPLNKENPNIKDPKAILITGITGFLGSHVLNELLEKTSAKIYCFVRSISNDEATKKITESLKKYRLFNEKYIYRIFPVLGDLQEEKLGLSEYDYNFIVKNVDVIYHIGAWVHHVYDYDTLYKTNVKSVLNLLEITISEKNKAIHFISTFGTNLISPLEKLPSANNTLFENHLNLNGYLTTKWVSEQLLKEAWLNGISAHVYRPGNIIAGSKGVYEPEINHTLLRLKGILQLKKAYVCNHELVEMMPVDLLSEAIVKISKNPEKFAYNMNNKNFITWHEYLKIAKSMGYECEFINDYNEWNEILNDLEEENSLYKLSYLYKIEDLNLNENLKKTYTEPDYLIKTPSYQEMVKKQFLILSSTGFLNKPSNIIEEINI